MDVCKCCKLAHKNLVFSHVTAEASREDYLPESVLNELGDPSLSWFEDLTESFLNATSSREKDGNNSLSDVSKTWSPCPRGGVATAKLKENVSDAAQLGSSKILFEHSANNRSSSCGDLCTSNADLSWTSAMATPLDTAGTISHFTGDSSLSTGCTQGSAKSETAATLRTPGSTEKEHDTVQAKVLSRMLFSPGQRSLSSDSLLGTIEWSVEDDETIEQEETICSESDAINNNSLKVNPSCDAKSSPVDEQDTITPEDSIACLSSNQSQSMNIENNNPSCISAEDKPYKKDIVGVCQSMDLKSNIGGVDETEFSDSFTAEEMEMVEDDCIEQTEKSENTNTFLPKTNTAQTLSFPALSTIDVATEKDKGSLTINNTKHPHVESVLSMIFPSQSIDPLAETFGDENLSLKDHSDMSKVERGVDKAKGSKEGLANIVGVQDKDTLTDKRVKNVDGPVSLPPSDVNYSFKEELSNNKETTTPQSILKKIQTPRSSGKKRVRFSIEADSSPLSQFEDENLADVIKQEPSSSNVISATVKTYLDVHEFTIPDNAGDSKLQSQCLMESVPDDSQSQDILVSSQVEDLSSLYSQDDNINMCTDDSAVSSRKRRELIQPMSKILISTEKAKEVHSIKEHLTITTPVNSSKLQDNVTTGTNEFVFDDLSPPLSPAFPSQVLSQAENSEGEMKCKPEVETPVADSMTSEVTVSNLLDLPNTSRSLFLTNFKVETVTQNENESDKNLDSVNCQSLNESSISRNVDALKSTTNAFILEDDDDDDMMCAAAMNAESNSDLVIKESLAAATENQIFRTAPQADKSTTIAPTDDAASFSTLSSSVHADKMSYHSNLIVEHSEVKSVSSKPSVSESRITSSNVITSQANTTSSHIFQSSNSNSTKPITPFTKPKSRKFLYPTSVQKQSAIVKEHNGGVSPLNTAAKKAGDSTKPLKSINHLSHDPKGDALLSVSNGESEQGRTISAPSTANASQSGNISNDNMDKPDPLLWSTALDKRTAGSSVRDTPVSSRDKKLGGYLGFAKFSDVFQDTDGPPYPKPAQKDILAVVGDLDGSERIQVEDNSLTLPCKTIIDMKTEDKDPIDFKNLVPEEKRDNRYPVSHEGDKDINVYKLSGIGNKDCGTRVDTEAAETLDKQSDKAGETSKPTVSVGCALTSADNILPEEFEEDFTSQMWKATEFSQIACDADDDVGKMEIGVPSVTTAAHVNLDKCNGSSDINVGTLLQESEMDRSDISNNQKLSEVVKSVEFFTNASDHRPDKIAFGFSNATSLFHNPSQPRDNFTVTSCPRADLVSQLENVIKAKKVPVNGKEGREAINQTLQTNKEFVGPNHFTIIDHAETGNADKLDALEDQLEQILQKGKTLNSSLAKKSCNIPLGSASSSKSTFEVAGAKYQDRKTTGKEYESTRNDISSTRIASMSSNLSTGGFTTAGGKGINMSAAAQNKARSLWESVTKELEDFNSKNALHDTDMDEVKFSTGVSEIQKQGESTRTSACGFTTAGGKDISMSLAAEVKAKKLWESVQEDVKDDGDNLLSVQFKDATKTEGKQVTSFQPHRCVSKLEESWEEDMTRMQKGNKFNVPKVDKRHKGFQPFKAPKILKNSAVLAKKDLDQNDKKLVNASTTKINGKLSAQTSTEDAFVEKSSTNTVATGANILIKNNNPEHAMISRDYALEINKLNTKPPLLNHDTIEVENNQSNQFLTDSTVIPVLNDEVPVKAEQLGKDSVFIESIDCSNSNQTRPIQNSGEDGKDNADGMKDLEACKVGTSKSLDKCSSGNERTEKDCNIMAQVICKQNTVTEESPRTCLHDSYTETTCNVDNVDEKSYAATSFAGGDSVLNSDGRNTGIPHSASTKAVSASGKSLDHARTILNDDSKQHCETKVPVNDILSESGFSSALGKSPPLSRKAVTEARVLLDNGAKKVCNPETDPSSCKPKLLGFSTASGKLVTVSDTALCQARIFLNDEDAHNFFWGKETISVSNQSNLDFHTPIGEPEMSVETATFPHLDATSSSKANVENIEPKPESLGFSTASDKLESVSEKALRQAKTFLEAEDEAQEICLTKKSFCLHGRDTKEVSTSSPGKTVCHEGNLSHLESNIGKRTSKPFSPGFSTVGVSEKALCHGKQFQSDNVQEVHDIKKTCTGTNTIELSTLPSNMISSSPHKADCQAVTLSDYEANIEKSESQPWSVGFSTASGKSVSVSEKTLSHAKTFVDDDVQSFGVDSRKPDVSKSCSSGFSTASEKTVSVSEKVLCHSKSFLDENPQSHSAKPKEPGLSKPSFSGFSTASGKSVTVSEKALRHAKTFLDEDPQIVSEPLINKSNTSGFSTASGKSVSVSEKALHHAKTFLDEDPQSLSTKLNEPDMPKPSCSGFSTASGKSVSVSEKALHHAKTFLDEDQQTSQTLSEPDSHKPSSSGFSTASGKAVAVSAKALSHARTFLEDNAKDSDNKTLPGSSGFSTASGKAVAVSAKALSHARTFLEDNAKDNSDNKTLPGSSGFSTASGQSVTVSEKALCKSKSIFEDNNSGSFDTSEKLIRAKPCMPGFSTAAGTSVSVSDKALHHARSLLNDSGEFLSPIESNGDMIKTRVLSSNTLEDPVKTNTGISTIECINQAIPMTNSSSNPTPRMITRSSTRVQCLEEANLNSCKNISKASPNDRVLRKKLQPKNAKCDEFQYDRSTPKLRKLGVLISTQCMEEKSNTAPSNTNENEAPTSFKPPYKKLKPEASGDCSLPLQGEDQNVKNSSVKISSFVPPPVVKSSTHLNLDSCGDRKEDMPDHKARPVFGPLKSTNPNLSSVQSEPRQKDSSEGSRLASGPNVLAEAKFRIYDKGSEYEDLDNEAENELLCSDFTEHDKNGFVEENVADCVQSKDSETRTDFRNEESRSDGNKSFSLQSNSKYCEKEIPSKPKQQFTGESDRRNILNVSEQGCGDKVSNEIDTSALNVGSDLPHGTAANKGTIVHDSVSEYSASNPEGQVSVISNLEFEEAVMAQEKMIRNKKRRKVQPCCGRWLGMRRKGGLDGKQLQPISSLAQESKESLTHHELLSLGVCPSILAVNSLNAKDYRFNLRRFFPSASSRILVGDGALLVPDRQGFAGAQEFYKAFLTLDGVDPNLCDEAWVRNHYRWLVWKLAAYEISWPSQFAGRCLTPDVLMLQLKYRYDREVDACHRSAIKKIVERDDTPCKRMVLCVAAVNKQAAAAPTLEVTDGWYSIQAQIDSALADLVLSSRIGPGIKIVTSGAELVGSHGACSPLEIPESLMLKLSCNSTRLARWHARLGYCAPLSPLCLPLVSLSHGGGTVGCVDVVLCRKYPTTFMEKLADGACVFRTLEEEEKVNRKHEEKRQDQIEKLYSALQAAGEKESYTKAPVRPKRLNRREIEKLWSGQELAEAMESSLNPEDFQQCLSAGQLERLSEFKRAEVDKRQQEIQLKLQEAMSDAGHVRRNVVPVKKFRVQGCCRTDIDSKTSCIVTVWRPGADWADMVEGRRYRLYSMTVGPTRSKSTGKGDSSKHVTLTATRQSRLQEKAISDNLLDLVYEKREVWTVSDLRNSHPKGDEFDFVGLLVKVKEADKVSQPTVLYVCDTEKEMLGVNIWPGRQSPLPCSVFPGQVICMSSLFLRQAAARDRPLRTGSILTADARPDFSTFSTSAHGSCYSSHFSQMELLAKKQEFLLEAQKILESLLLQVRAHASNPSNQLTERQPNAKPELSVLESNDEDFPPDVIEQIFNKMSQGSFTENPQQPLPQDSISHECSDRENLSESETNAELSREANTTKNSSVSESCSSSTKDSARQQSSVRKRRHSELGNTSCSDSGRSLVHNNAGDLDEGSEILKKRKLMLRQKMSKLLAYESPSPLSPIPTALSPASRKAFKTPLMNQKL